MGKSLPYLKNGGIGVDYCWNYGPSKLLLHFIEYCLDQLENKHTKTAVNSTMQFFESHYQRKYMVKVWRFLAHPPQNDGPVKFLQNWKATIFSWLIFSNCVNIRHLAYWKCVIWTESELPIINEKVCEKVWFTINRLSKGLFFNFCLFVTILWWIKF